MITRIAQRTENGKKIDTYNVVCTPGDNEQGTLIKQIMTIADSFLEFVKIVPLWNSPRVMDAFIISLPDDLVFKSMKPFVNITDFPELTGLFGYGIQIQQNYSFEGLKLPVFKNYNGQLIINFESQVIDPNQGSGYLVEVYTSHKRGEN